MRSSGARGSIDVPGSTVSSRSSLVVKAAWRGPRHLTMETWRTAERRRTSSTGSGISYVSRDVGGASSMRATSSVTLPWPIMETCSVSCSGGAAGRDRCCVY